MLLLMGPYSGGCAKRTVPPRLFLEYRTEKMDEWTHGSVIRESRYLLILSIIINLEFIVFREH